MSKKFLRRDWNRNPKLGKGRKKKQVWRRPTGRDNKMREKRKGYPSIVSIGYKKSNEERNKIKDKAPIKVFNIKELENVKKGQIVILGKMGKKKKKELATEIKKRGIEVANLNVNKFLKGFEKKTKQNTEEKKNESK